MPSRTTTRNNSQYGQFFREKGSHHARIQYHHSRSLADSSPRSPGSSLKGDIVIAANSGYRQGWMHFSARSATGINLVEFLREKASAGADANYGSGHEQANGGALQPEAWNEFVDKLGFGPEARVAL